MKVNLNVLLVGVDVKVILKWIVGYSVCVCVCVCVGRGGGVVGIWPS